MDKQHNKSLYILTGFMIVLGILISALGLFYSTGGEPFIFINQFGDTVKINGDGIYATDSYLRAPIFKGTDFTILFIVIPVLIYSLILDIKKGTLKSRMFLMSVITIITYYSISIAIGVSYNNLHLLYIALFSVSFFGFIIAIGSINRKFLEESINKKVPYNGIYTFLIFTGIALIIAWIPDIVAALLANRSLALIEVYTTEITYVLDMGIIGPAAILGFFLLKKRKGLGYIILSSLLTLCCIMGIMLPIQTVFQLMAGIELPLPVILTKVCSFVVLAVVALYYNIKFFNNIKS
jgi:hypothetical protein